MLQNGVSRQLFERWCEDERSGVVLAGYSVEGTLAKKLLSEPEEVTCLDGRIKRRKCSIEYISFSAHVDFIQNTKYDLIWVSGHTNMYSPMHAYVHLFSGSSGRWCRTTSS